MPKFSVRSITQASACKNPPVANPDRLTGLDSSFLHLERDSAHMHVAGCAIFAAPPGIQRAGRRDRLPTAPRPPLPTAAGVRPPRPGPARVGGRPPFQAHLPRPSHGAAPPRRRGRAQATGRARVLAGARSLQAAVGAVARRGRRATVASRCSRRPITRSSTGSPASTSRPSCSTPRPTRPRSRRPSTSGSRGRCRATPSCWPTRCSSGRRCLARSRAGCVLSSAARARSPTASARLWSASARWPGRD